jgi:CheY-like chemotaxis protein
VAPVDTYVQIRVSDTGQGIPSEFLPHIFERFRQADASMSRVHGGLGIGLAIVKQLVELHGGEVRAESAGPNLGATFVIQLPLGAARALPPLPGDGTSSVSSNGTGLRLDGLRVLIVDDEADTIAWMQRVLHRAGARVTMAQSAPAAWEQLRDESYDVIVSDIGMPAVDGYEFIAEVRRREIRTPALALTAFAHPQDRAKALQSGFQAHIAKPVDVEEWLASIEALAAGGDIRSGDGLDQRTEGHSTRQV